MQKINIPFFLLSSPKCNKYLKGPSSNSVSDANNYENDAMSDGAGLLAEQPNLPDPGSPWPGLQQGGAGEGGGGEFDQ